MDLALFDFDGTITTADTLPSFVRTTVNPLRLRAGEVLLAPLVAGYRAGLVSGSAIRAAVVRVGLTGMPAARFEERAHDFAAAVLPNLLRAEAMQRLERHRARGDRIVVVSGNFETLLRPWCATHGLELIASTLACREGRLTGRYAGPQCVGREKARRVLERLDPREYHRIHAYGDTVEDRELLALADRAYYRGRRLRAGAALTR